MKVRKKGSYIGLKKLRSRVLGAMCDLRFTCSEIIGKNSKNNYYEKKIEFLYFKLLVI